MQNIEELVISSGGPLREEPLNLLAAETREPGRYIQVLEAISSGASTLGEIADKAKIGISEISKYTGVLERQLDLVGRNYPLLERKRGKARYHILDEFTSFWYKFIYPNSYLLEMGDEDSVIRQIESHLDEHASRTFEKVALEHLFHLKAREALHFDHIGPWWSGDTEIDAVAVNEADSTTYFVEAKWAKSPVDRKVLYELTNKASEFPWRKGKRKENYVIYSRAGFKFSPEPEVMLVKLGDMGRDFSNRGRASDSRKE